MNRTSRTLILILSLLLTGAALMVVRSFRAAQWKTALHARCAAEGEAAVLSYLKSGGHGAVQTNGAFVGLAGTGYSPPVWNSAGYFFLWMDRKATFASGTIPLRIYVTEGRKTALGVTILGTTGWDEPGRISVSHPDLIP